MSYFKILRGEIMWVRMYRRIVRIHVGAMRVLLSVSSVAAIIISIAVAAIFSLQRQLDDPSQVRSGLPLCPKY
jgi:hypothetical protein